MAGDTFQTGCSGIFSGQLPPQESADQKNRRHGTFFILFQPPRGGSSACHTETDFSRWQQNCPYCRAGLGHECSTNGPPCPALTFALCKVHLQKWKIRKPKTYTGRLVLYPNSNYLGLELKLTHIHHMHTHTVYIYVLVYTHIHLYMEGKMIY